jgi:hypothetical protein
MRILAIALVCGFLLFGCAGQAAPEKGAGTGQQNAPAGANGAANAGTGNANTGANVGAGNAAAGTNAGANDEGSNTETGAADQFAKLIGMRKGGWKAVYDVKTTDAPTSELTQYMKGDMARIDMAVSGSETRAYMKSGYIYTCTKQPDWQCFKFPMTPEQKAAGVDTEIDKNPSSYKPVLDGTLQIAGTTATCFKLTAPDSTQAAGSTSRYCVSPEGVPLYAKVMKSSGETMTEMTAKSYSATVPDSDFEPPAVAQEIQMPG